MVQIRKIVLILIHVANDDYLRSTSINRDIWTVSLINQINCVCLFVYVYLFVCMFVYVFVSLRVFVSLFACVCVWFFSVRFCLWAFVSLCVLVCVCVSGCLHFCS